MDEIARVGRGLGNAARLHVLILLGQRERSVQEIAELSQLNVTTASAHLQVLRDLGLVVSRRSGKQVIYRLAGNDVAELVSVLQRVAERRQPGARVAWESLQSRAFEALPAGAVAMQRDELIEAVRAGRVTVIDVRPLEEYAAGHLPGAVSIPLGDLLDRLGQIPTDQQVVAYCRGRHCTLSTEAASLLADRGFDARPAADGILEWRADGMDLDVDPVR